MSSYSEYIKSLKESRLTKFFGEVNHRSNKYFTFNHVINEDECIVITGNVTYVKDNPVLVVDHNKAVYLKDWLVEPIRNYDNGIYAYAVKLNRNFFKKYTFKKDFEDFYIEKEYEFDDLMQIAKEQDAESMPIALGH